MSFAGQAPVKNAGFGTFDFPTLVRYALMHSEDFLKSRIDIQVASADLKDAHSEILPTLQIITRYYLSRAQSTISNDTNYGGFSLQILMTNWDPYLALLKMKSNAILVDIGKINHMNRMVDNTARLAKIFYRVHSLERLIRARKQSLALHQNKLDFVSSRKDQGGSDDLTVRTVANQVKSEVLRIKGLEQELEQQVSELKILIGYQPDYVLPLETRDAANQILSGFNGKFIGFPDIQGQNLRLRIMAKQEQLQSNRVTGSYVSLVPKPLIVFETVENQVDRSSGFNFALGLDYTIWDGFKRVRDIKRQKLKAEQLKIDRSLQSERLYMEFKRLRDELNTAGEKEGLQWEQVKVAEMAEEKALIMYKSGDLTYDQYVQKRIERVEAEINSISSMQTRVNSLIDLATMAGGLNRYNAQIQF